MRVSRPELLDHSSDCRRLRNIENVGLGLLTTEERSVTWQLLSRWVANTNKTFSVEETLLVARASHFARASSVSSAETSGIPVHVFRSFNYATVWLHQHAQVESPPASTRQFSRGRLRPLYLRPAFRWSQQNPSPLLQDKPIRWGKKM